MSQAKKWVVTAEDKPGSEFREIVTADSPKEAADWAITNWLYDASEGPEPFTWTIWIQDESRTETVATFRIKIQRVTTVFAYQEVRDGVPKEEQLEPPFAELFLKFKTG